MVLYLQSQLLRLLEVAFVGHVRPTNQLFQGEYLV